MMNKKAAVFNLVFALAIILAINTFFFLGQVAIEKINPGGDITFYNYKGSMIEGFDSGNYTIDETIQNKLPSSSSAVGVEEGNFFTDTFAAIKDWALNTTGLRYVLNIINAVPNFLKAIGLPQEVAFALGVFWHGLSFFLLVVFLKGGS